MPTPTRWWPFDGQVPNGERVTRVLDWLALPEGERPALLTLYFQEVDHIGHVNGPDSAEVLEAAAHLDEALGQLVAGLFDIAVAARSVVDDNFAWDGPGRVVLLETRQRLNGRAAMSQQWPRRDGEQRGEDEGKSDPFPHGATSTL